MHSILLYYKYVRLADPAGITAQQMALCQKLGLTGRIIIAHEGINGTVEGLFENVEAYIAETKKISEFSDINFKVSPGTGKSFPKLTVRARKEIVTLGKPDLFPIAGETGGKYLSPDELHQWFEKGREDFVILDMRNDYEYDAGRFENSVVLPVRHFREIPEMAVAQPEMLASIKGKTVVAVCTGGIRCEKGTAYLKKELGFHDVYQLHDGIVTYMNKYPEGHFKGSLYVFDGRVTMRTEGMPEEVLGVCKFCSTPSEKFVNCPETECQKHFIICDECLEKKGGKDRVACVECSRN